MEQACERQRRAIAGRKVNMRLATFVDPLKGNDARFGIVSGEKIVDVVAAADALQRAVPASSVKIALTSGAHTLAALQELVVAAERAKLLRAVSGVKFLPPIQNPSKFFCVGKHNKRHREELAANKNLWGNCEVNGRQRLRSNTGDYLYKISDVLEHFSRYVVFEPGDLIAMGASSGVAVGQPNAEELYLKPGDDMVISFEGLMSLCTKIVAPR